MKKFVASLSAAVFLEKKVPFGLLQAFSLTFCLFQFGGACCGVALWHNNLLAKKTTTLILQNVEMLWKSLINLLLGFRHPRPYRM